MKFFLEANVLFEQKAEKQAGITWLLEVILHVMVKCSVVHIQDF